MRLSVTTPRGSIVEADVDELTAPGVLGELGVLPGHVPFMTALKPGVLTYKGRDRAGVLAVGQGFLQVAPAAGASGAPATEAAPKADRVLVLVDQATGAASIDRAAAERDLAKVEAELASWKDTLDGAYQVLLSRRDWALARVAAASR